MGRGVRTITEFFLNSNFILALRPIILKHKMKLYRNQSINESIKVQPISFKNGHIDLNLGPRELKLNLYKDIIIFSVCVKLNQN